MALRTFDRLLHVPYLMTHSQASARRLLARDLLVDDLVQREDERAQGEQDAWLGTIYERSRRLALKGDTIDPWDFDRGAP